jgi:hypothetical protein
MRSSFLHPQAIPSAPVGIMAEAPPSRRFARRMSRVVFGGSLIALPPLLWAGWMMAHSADPASRYVPHNLALLNLAMVWLVAIAAAVVARQAARLSVVRGIFGDDAFATASIVVPAVGVALVVPISLQAVVGAPFALLAGANFDSWLGFALGGTALAHVAFAFAMGWSALKVARGHDVRRVVLWPAVVLSFLPGIIILFPPILVWVTGLVVSQGFLRRARRWLADDADADDGDQSHISS